MGDPTPSWAARTGEIAADLASYGETTAVDEHFLEADLAGSIAHVLTLHEAELVTPSEATRLIGGLQTLAGKAAEGDLLLDPALEDVHANVEHELGELVGPLADKLHTARSRNDQVALDLRLFVRRGLVELASATRGLAVALAARAREHTATPWPLHTHGLPGQPATLGYLLHAHALRLTRDVEAVLAAFHGGEESPLGAAAGAGTTLGTDPALGASALGLEPPGNGLLATGSRDASIEAAGLAARVGRHAGDLAVDLLDLHGKGALALPGAYTTGSSIMPHKANPDGLELARADAGRLAALADAVQRTASGLGLGYQRDLQRAKPPLVEALGLAPETLGVLAHVVEGFAVDAEVLAGMQARPAVATTDAAEALVERGLAFRRAHQLVARACRRADDEDVPVAAALETVLSGEIAPATVEAALAALEADPARRDATGGPAPAAVREALDALAARLDGLADEVDEAAEAARTPLALLETPPDELLAQAPEVPP